MAGNQMVVRIVGDTKELQQALKDGQSAIVALGPSVASLTAKWTSHSQTLVQDARNITAAVKEVGAATLTTGDSARALKTLDAAMAQLKASGQPIPGLMKETADQLRAVADASGKADDKSKGFFSTLAGGVTAGNLLSSALEKLGTVAVDVLKDAAHWLAEITLQGSRELGIEKAFNRLTSGVGMDAVKLLQDLQRATHGTVEESALLVRVNENLAAGMNLTSAQYRTLAQGAFALSKATGVDVKDALDKMNDAMLTGRTRAVALLTGKIDLKDAEEKFARSIGTTADQLSAEGKIEAARQVILEKVGASVARLGEQQDGLGTKVKQARVWWKDFQDELGKTIAGSPVLLGLLDQIGLAVSSAFGVSKEQLVKHLGMAVDELVISLIGLGASVAPVVGAIGTEFNAIQVLFRNVMQVIDFALLAVKGLALAGLEAADAITPGGAFIAQQQRIRGEMGALVRAIDARKVAIQEDKKAEDDWWNLGQRLSASLTEMQAKLATSRRTFTEHKTEVEKSGVALAKNTDKFIDNGKATEKAAAAQKKWLDSVHDLRFVLDFQQQGLGNLNHITVTSTGLLEQYADTLDNLASSDLPRMYETLGAVGHKIVSVSLDTEQASLTFRERFAASVGKATDVLDQLSRVAEMSGHRTTAALMSTASATAKAFASGGPWAAAIAFASGMLTTFADKLFKIEGKKVNDLRDAFVSAAGGIDALNRQAVAAGTTLDALLKAKTVKEYEAAVAALNGELAKTAALQGELAGLQAQLAGRQVMDWQRAQELIERYGGTLGNLGRAFSDAKQAADWKTIWDDWQTLIDMGADVGGVLVSMKDEIGALVQESLRIGTEIPEQFKPLIEELIRTGQLFDANGDAITDISQLKFGAPLVSEVDKIITKIDALIEALTGHLIPAIGRIPREIEIGVGYTYDEYEPPEGGSGGGGPWNDWPGGGDSASYGGAQAGGGDYLVTRPTWFLAGEAGPERATFTPRGSGSGSTASSAGSAVNVSITIQALDPVGLKQVVERDVVPLLVSAYRRNVNGARTDTRKELVD